MAATKNAPNAQLSELVNFQKLSSQILANQEAHNLKNEHKSKVRWRLFFIGIGLFFLSKYIVLKSEYKYIFSLFSAENLATADGLACANGQASAWNIVLGKSYPWVCNLVIENPLAHTQALFLDWAIHDQWIPTQEQIDTNEFSSGMHLSPLSYLCGDIYAIWHNATGKTFTDITNSPETTPWVFFLSGSNPRSAILDDPERLSVLVTRGFWGIAQYSGSASTTPEELYNSIFAKEPPDNTCSTAGTVGSVSMSVATFTMAGSAFAPPYGAVVGAGVGLGLGLMQNQSECGNQGCVIL